MKMKNLGKLRSYDLSARTHHPDYGKIMSGVIMGRRWSYKDEFGEWIGPFEGVPYFEVGVSYRLEAETKWPDKYSKIIQEIGLGDIVTHKINETETFSILAKFDKEVIIMPTEDTIPLPSQTYVAPRIRKLSWKEFFENYEL